MNPWAFAWQETEKLLGLPDRVTDIRSMDWGEFVENVAAAREEFVERFVTSLVLGTAWIFKGALSPDFAGHMREATRAWERGRQQSFHKMLDGVPDFHRMIDAEASKLYSILAVKHSAYFFRFNGDPLSFWPTITERWRVLKTVMGLSPTEYETNQPSDGPIDRIQVVRYPPAIGYLEPHRDAFAHQRCFISGYLSKRGVDYEGGGFYFVDVKGEARYVEDEIDVGDLCIGHANLLHGVAPCDRGKPVDWNAADGRWFLGLYSNASDYGTKRSTSKPERVIVPGVLP